jgi:hypothetical protein
MALLAVRYDQKLLFSLPERFQHDFVVQNAALQKAIADANDPHCICTMEPSAVLDSIALIYNAPVGTKFSFLGKSSAKKWLF